MDHQPVPDLKTSLHTGYVDNFVCFSQEASASKQKAEQVGGALTAHGLPTHPVEAGVGMETLGWAFAEDKPQVRLTTRRLWRLRMATLTLLEDGKADGRLIEKLIGHFTFAGLLQRSFLSIFQAAYVFVKKHYDDKRWRFGLKFKESCVGQQR